MAPPAIRGLGRDAEFFQGQHEQLGRYEREEQRQHTAHGHDDERERQAAHEAFDTDGQRSGGEQNVLSLQEKRPQGEEQKTDDGE